MAWTFHLVRVGVGAQFPSIKFFKIDQMTDRAYGIGIGSCSGYINIVYI